MFRIIQPQKTSLERNPYAALCEIFDITPSRLAALACASPLTVQKWIDGKSLPSGQCLAAISSSFGVSIDALLKGKIILHESKIEWHSPFIPSAIVIQCYREKKCISIPDFARQCGLEEEEIIWYEAGKPVPYNAALAISNKYGIPIELLIGFDDYYWDNKQAQIHSLLALISKYSADSIVLNKLLQKMLCNEE